MSQLYYSLNDFTRCTFFEHEISYIYYIHKLLTVQELKYMIVSIYLLIS